MKKLSLILATGFGFGLSPVASGTVGTFWGIVIVYILSIFDLAIGWQIAVSVVLVLLAIPICGSAESILETHDDGRIVADEYLTFPICMIGLPWNPWIVLFAFLTCRVFDILKPPPARQCESLSGGLGIVMDDVFASLYSLGVNHLFFWFAWPLITARFFGQ